MTNVQKNRFLQYIPNLISIVLGIIAIILSLQAYRVTNELKESKPNVVISYVSYDDLIFLPSGRTDGTDLLCTQSIRFQNSGGNPTSLTGFDLIVSNGDGKSFQLSNENGKAQIFASSGVFPGIHGFQASIFPNGTKFWEQQRFENLVKLNLPMDIAPYSAIDVQSGLRFFVETSLWDTINKPHDYPLLLITLVYTFHFASGQSVSTPEMQCFWQ
jgi:hypothetical protein